MHLCIVNIVIAYDLGPGINFNRDAWNKFGKYGVQGCLIPKEYGDKKLNILSMVVGMETLGYSCLEDGLFCLV